MKNYYKFRFSAMIPSEWFHKLKNMTKPRKKLPLPSFSLNTANKEKNSSESKYLPHSSSSYFSNKSHTSLEESKVLQNSPRNSLHMMQSKRKTVYKPSPPSNSSSVSAGFNKNKIKLIRNQDSSAASSNLKLNSSADDSNNRHFQKKLFKEIKVFDSTEKACPAKKRTKESRKTRHLSVKVNNKEKEEEDEDACRIHKKHQKTLVSSGRRSSANSPRTKLRVSSPRIQVSARRSKSRSQSKQVLESFAVIKSSIDPNRDFRESMVEMIEENNIRASQDLEDLLACYLSLNPKEYHDLIIKVFVQVWLEGINSKFASK